MFGRLLFFWVLLLFVDQGIHAQGRKDLFRVQVQVSWAQLLL